jgi:hypothetical protein
MGLSAVGVQWYAVSGVNATSSRKLFRALLATSVLATLSFFILNVFVVERVGVAGGETAANLVGFGDPTCAECAGKSTTTCLREISFDPARIADCWGATNVRLARMSLTLAYLFALSSFGGLVGALVVAAPAIKAKRVGRRGRGH